MDKICGKWQVKMLDWWITGIKMPRWAWWWFSNVKVIWQNSDGAIQGHNVLWGWRKWGDFDVEILENLCGALFHYKHFYDWVQMDGDCANGYLYIGRKRMAAFTMTRILPEKEVIE